ncbi:hypothetical protein ACIBSW_32480 [Actinoplanes sp. NPDC049668]|uniref:hypothetical protein n=1 Tax=unclassified Actinoplanes TaxID=2626549 RepID=UPI0033B52BA8
MGALLLAVGFLIPSGPAAAAPAAGGSLAYGNVTISGAAGERVDVVFAVRNDGDSPIYGARIDLALGENRLTPLFDAANCYHPEAARLACDFAGTFAPHTAYRLVLPFRVVDRYPHQIVPGVYYWDTLPERPAGGSGTELVLDPPLGPLPADAPPTGHGPGYWVLMDITGGAAPDVAVTSEAGVSAAIGDVIRPVFTVRNVGAMSINLPRPWPDTEPVVRPRHPLLRVAIPDGAVVVAVADGCERISEDQGGYDCRSPREIPAGGTVEFPFELRLDADLVDAEAVGTTVVPDDGVAANNVARFIINPTAGTPSASPSTPSAGPTGAAGGSGGSLPITGPGPVLPIAAASLAAGVALLVGARRRRS